MIRKPKPRETSRPGKGRGDDSERRSSGRPGAGQPGRSGRPDRPDRPNRKDTSFAPKPRQGGFSPRPKKEAAPAFSEPRWDTPREQREERPAAPEARLEREDQNLLPGVKPVLEMLESAPERVDAIFLRKGRHGAEMDRIADLCRERGIRFSLLAPEQFSRIYSGGSQGVVARLFEAGFVEWEDLMDKVMDAPLPLVLALDQVQDPGNAGTLARTLYALGGAGLVVPRHNGVFLGAAASRTSAGALAHLPVAKAANLGQALDQAKDLGFTIYGAAAEGSSESGKPSENIFRLTPRLPAVLVLGSEEAGLRPMVEKRCDTLVHIPMLRDFDSINVAQAGAIIMGMFSTHAKK